MDIDALLNELEELGDEGDKPLRKLLPSFSRTSIDAAKFFSLVDKIRSSLPEDVRSEQEIARRREQIIEEAQEERAKILEAARQQAEVLISQEHTLQEAQHKAAETAEQTKVEAESLHADADEYARMVLSRLEEMLQRALATVSQSKAALQEDDAPAAGGGP